MRRKRLRPIIGQLQNNPHCPRCTTKLDGFTGINGKSPDPGDMTICAYCAVWMVFTDDLQLRLATTAEQEEARKMPEMAFMEILQLRVLFARESK